MTDEIDLTTNKVLCPHCGGDVQLKVRVGIKTVSGEVTRDIPAAWLPPTAKKLTISKLEAWLATLTPTQRGIIQEAEDSGLIAALRTAVEHIPAQSRPKLIEKYLLTVLATADPINSAGTIPRGLLIRLRDVYPDGFLALYKAHSVLIVVLGGRLVGFLPTSVLNEAKPSRFHNTDPEDAGWFKTRFGYVVKGGPFYEALRKRYLGEFDTVT